MLRYEFAISDIYRYKFKITKVATYKYILITFLFHIFRYISIWIPDMRYVSIWIPDIRYIAICTCSTWHTVRQFSSSSSQDCNLPVPWSQPAIYSSASTGEDRDMCGQSRPMQDEPLELHEQRSICQHLNTYPIPPKPEVTFRQPLIKLLRK